MKNIVLFRLKGDDAIWLADLEAGTVERTDAFDTEVDVAVTASARADAPSHQYFPNRGVQAEGIDMAVATSARADAPSHRFFPSA